MAKRKKVLYQEIIEVFKNNPDISGTELAQIFKKDASWGRRLKQFYFASKEEKEQLKEQHHIFKTFYNLYQNYLENNPDSEIIEPEKEEEEQMPVLQEQQELDQEEKELSELELKTKKLEQMVISLAVELTHLRESNKGLIEDNAAKGLNINRLINTKNELTAKLNQCSKDLKYYKVCYWIFLVGYVIEILILWLKG